MKKDWTYKKLGEVAEVIGGSTPKTSEPANWKGSNMWVTPAELDGSKYFGKTQRTISDEAASKLQLLPIGTVLFSSRAPIGKVAITTAPMYCNQGFKNIVCGEGLCNEYVYWCLKYNVPLLQSLGVGATFKELSKSAMSDFSIPIPPLSIQHSIVRELDLLHSMIEKKKEQLYELDNLAQSLFYQMFGDPITNPMSWEVKRLGEVCDKITDGSHNPPKGVDHSAFRMLSSQNIFNGYIDYSAGIRYLTKEDFEIEDRRTNLQVGDVLMTIVGTIGRTCIVSSLDTNITLQRSVAVLRPNKILGSKYLSYFMMSINSILNREAHGIAQKGIYLKQLSNFSLPLPPLSLQQSFAAKIEAIEAQKALVRQSIEEAHTLLAARMQYYFE